MKKASAWLMALLFAAPLAAAPRTVTLSVPGMHCPTCPITVKKALSQVPGVNKVSASLEPRQATVSFDDARIRAEDLTLATQEAGYPSRVVEQAR